MEAVFDPAFLHRYKGFTHPAHRGNRLISSGLAHALEVAKKRGLEGLFLFIETRNYSSKKAALRTGYRRFGTVWALGAFGRFVMLRTPGCKRYAFGVRRRNYFDDHALPARESSALAERGL